MRSSVAARVFDPLWLMTRQWQLGEFQGEDCGTPVLARVRARSGLLSRCHLGALAANTQTQAPPYDPQAMPLEVMVERQRVRAASPEEPRALAFAIEAGLQFLRLLELQPLSKGYRAAFISRFALQGAAPADADEATVRTLQTMAGRALDARRLEAQLRSTGAARLALDPLLKIAVADRAEVEQAATRWLAWLETVFCEPAAGAAQAWIPERMEHALAVAARLSEAPLDEKALTAAEFYEGHLDWASFDLDAEVRLGAGADRRFEEIVETTVPAPVTFRGMPAARYWEFEDARIAYGLMPVGPTDLMQLLMIEYASGWGNDWFVVPLTLPVGSLTAVNSLVVTDTFGVRHLLRPIGDRALPRPHWSMYQLAYLRRAGSDLQIGPEPNLYFLPPALGRSLEGPALEEVLFMRDEMANVAWAIEQRIESPLESAQPRADATPPPSDLPPSLDRAAARYRLASSVPTHWVPLLPVQLAAAGRVVTRLRRGAVLQPDGTQQVHEARGRILNPGGALLMHDEEVPREGVHVSRHLQLARWIDGSTWAWAAHRKRSGRGEGSSGLQFDRVDD